MLQQVHWMPALVTAPEAFVAKLVLSAYETFSFSLSTPQSISHVRMVCFLAPAAAVPDVLLLFLRGLRLDGTAEAEVVLFLFLLLLGAETVFSWSLPWAPWCMPAGPLVSDFLPRTFLDSARVLLPLGARVFRTPSIMAFRSGRHRLRAGRFHVGRKR